MTDDIVTRLRDRAYSFKAPDRLVEEAADVIERTRARVTALEVKAAQLESRLFLWEKRMSDGGDA